MQSLLHTTSDVELRLFRRDLRTIERALARGPCPGSDSGCCGVGLAQCHALLALSSEGSGLSALAHELDVEASTLTRTLDGLEKLGLVARSQADGDRRSIVVRLTHAGETKVAEIDRIWNAWFENTLAPMRGDERHESVKGVASLAQAFRSRSCCSPKHHGKEES